MSGTKKKKVLVVDDDKDTCSQMILLLELLGYEALRAGNATEAVAVFKEHAVDAVLTDLVLPDKRGTLLVHDLHALRPTVPVIILTAYPSQDTVVEALRENSYTYLTKPISGEEIKTVLEHAFTAG
jgi:DNA-binding NtrC family response regulator